MDFVESVQVGVVAVLALALVCKVLAQRRRGVRVLTLSRGKKDFLGRLEPLSVGILLLWFGAIALDGAGRAPKLFEPRLFHCMTIHLAGAGLALVSLGIWLTALYQMGPSWKMGIDPESQESLVTRGVFSVSRNPIFLAIDLFAIAAFLMSGALFFLVSGVFVLAGIHVQILREERFLTGAHGDAYAFYRARVRRYVGRRP